MILSEFPIFRYTLYLQWNIPLNWLDFYCQSSKLESKPLVFQHFLSLFSMVTSPLKLISWQYLLLVCSGISVLTVMMAYYFPLANKKFTFYSCWSNLENKYILVLNFCYVYMSICYMLSICYMDICYMLYVYMSICYLHMLYGEWYKSISMQMLILAYKSIRILVFKAILERWIKIERFREEMFTLGKNLAALK